MRATTVCFSVCLFAVPLLVSQSSGEIANSDQKSKSGYIFIGTNGAVEIFSSLSPYTLYRLYDSDDPKKRGSLVDRTPPCLNIDFNSIDGSGGPAQGTIFAKNCSVSSGSELIAHGIGWNKKVILGEMNYRKYGDTQDFVLLGSIDGLPGDPVIYSRYFGEGGEPMIVLPSAVDPSTVTLPNALHAIAANENWSWDKLQIYREPAKSNRYLGIYQSTGLKRIQADDESSSIVRHRDLFILFGEGQEIKILQQDYDEFDLHKHDISGLRFKGFIDLDVDGDMDLLFENGCHLLICESAFLGFTLHYWERALR